MKRHFVLIFFGFSIGLLLYGFANFNRLGQPMEFYLSGFLGILVLYAVSYANSGINKLVSWKELPGMRLLLGIVSNLVVSVGLSYAAITSYHLLMDEQLRMGDHWEELLKLGIVVFSLSIIHGVVYFALYSYNQYTKVQIEELRQQRKQAEIQLNLLRSQLSPHFLFNSMNSLSMLFHKDPQQAETFIRALATCYEYPLAKHRVDLVTIDEELDFVNAFSVLLSTRFGDGFSVEVDLPEAIRQSKVPPLTLQLLVENAAKHNVFNSEMPLRVVMDLQDDHIVVMNNKTGQRKQVNSTKLGLSNIKRRYRLLTRQSVEVLDQKDFSVKLPVLI